MGRRLLGVVDSQAAEDTRSIPHAYSIILHPDDRAAFADVETDLVRELAEAVTQHGERESYRLSEPVVVVLREDASTKRGSIAVVPSLVTAPTPVQSRTDSNEAVVIQPIAASMATPIAGAITSALITPDGVRHVLETERVTIGRQSGCTVIIRDTNVSREHAQLRRRPNGWTLRDLGSTNGTKLNGVRVDDEQMLADGDVIMLGAIKVTFEIS